MHEDHISIKSGLPPGIPIYIGKEEAKETTITTVWYNDKEVQVYTDNQADTIISHISPSGITWISISGLKNADLISSIFSKLALHPLITEDVFNTKGRSKLEDFDKSLFLVLEMVNNGNHTLHSQKIDIYLTNGFLLSVSEFGDPFEPIRERIQHPNGKMRSYGIDYLMYALIDTIVDSYFYYLETIEEFGEKLEERVLLRPKPEIVRDIQLFRHKIIIFRKQVWALREVILHLGRSDSNIIQEPTRIFMRDVYDHIIKISEDLDIHRDIAEGIMEIYLSSISNRTNEIVKILTVITVIFIPLTFITGVFGMNFSFMPGIHDPNAHIIIFAIMICIAGFMVILFRLKKWI